MLPLLRFLSDAVACRIAYIMFDGKILVQNNLDRCGMAIFSDRFSKKAPGF